MPMCKSVESKKSNNSCASMIFEFLCIEGSIRRLDVKLLEFISGSPSGWPTNDISEHVSGFWIRHHLLIMESMLASELIYLTHFSVILFPLNNSDKQLIA